MTDTGQSKLSFKVTILRLRDIFRGKLNRKLFPCPNFIRILNLDFIINHLQAKVYNF